MHWIDPEYLPTTLGVVKQFVPNPHGKLDGLVLIEETGAFTLIHFPPHLTEQVTAAVHLGDEIRVRGVKPRDAAVIAAVALIAADGTAIVDYGPPDKKQSDTDENEKPTQHPERTIAGRVALSLYAPKGQLRGALLEDGSVLRINPKEAIRVATLLQPHATVSAGGRGIETPYGTVMDVWEIGAGPSEMRPVKITKPEKMEITEVA